ncbi:bactericidal permeability-increasing protein-like [Acropora palmata]|uniref:bactericidal permeability-increasing protein-like n=1 Tax=Acropora palmata TaxID=6131 RepID=UPI003DA137C1
MGSGCPALKAAMARIFGLNTFIAAFILVSSQATKPGIRFRITDNGLRYVDSIAIQTLERKVKTAKIPDISGDAHTPIGHVSYSLSSVHFNSLSVPYSTLKTSANVGIQFQVTGASTSLSGNWHYRKDSWPHISGGGSFDLDVKGISVTVIAKLGVDSGGHPSIASANCSSSIGGVSIHFHGGASWLYNLFDHYIDGKIKGVLQDKLCAETSDLIDTDAEKALATFPVQKRIGKYAVINYALVSSPNFTQTFADVFIKGEFLSAISPREPPFSPSLLPFESESDKMVYVWLTDYVVNTAGFVYQSAGVLNETITPSMLPPNFSYPLNTNTVKLIIPKLYALYPNMPMKLEAYSTQRPQISTTSAGLSLLIEGQVQCYVQLKNGSYVYTLTMGTNISSLAKVGVKDGNITAHVNSVKIQVKLIDSAIGKISIETKLLQFLLDAFADRIIVNQLNKIAEVGFPLPMVDGIQIMNAEVMSGQGFNMVAADIKYEPTKTETERGMNKIVIV